MSHSRAQPFEKVTIRLRAGDKHRLDELFPHLGHNKVIRASVARLIQHADAQTQREIGERLPALELSESDMQAITREPHE